VQNANDVTFDLWKTIEVWCAKPISLWGTALNAKGTRAFSLVNCCPSTLIEQIQCSLVKPPPSVYLLNMFYLYLCICTRAKCMSVELKVYLFIWSHNFRFSMSLSLSPNSLYRQTTDCTEGGGLTREHCIYNYTKMIRTMLVSVLFSKIWQLFWTFWQCMINTINAHCL
jgi:hypothetical protein